MRISDWSSDVCSSDLYPNQVNNVLCFPYIFRGALDVGATEINAAMKLACVRAIARLAQMESSDLGSAYGGEVTSFGADSIIPRPFDPRLLPVLAPCGAEAARESGVALRPVADWRPQGPGRWDGGE